MSSNVAWFQVILRLCRWHSEIAPDLIPFTSPVLRSNKTDDSFVFSVISVSFYVLICVFILYVNHLFSQKTLVVLWPCEYSSPNRPVLFFFNYMFSFRMSITCYSDHLLYLYVPVCCDWMNVSVSRIQRHAFSDFVVCWSIRIKPELKIFDCRPQNSSEHHDH